MKKLVLLISLTLVGCFWQSCKKESSSSIELMSTSLVKSELTFESSIVEDFNQVAMLIADILDQSLAFSKNDNSLLTIKKTTNNNSIEELCNQTNLDLYKVQKIQSMLIYLKKRTNLSETQVAEIASNRLNFLLATNKVLIKNYPENIKKGLPCWALAARGVISFALGPFGGPAGMVMGTMGLLESAYEMTHGGC